METKVSYTLVGLFVVILGITLIVIPLWLSSGMSGKHYNIYEVLMKESVSGLNVNSSVKYNGVDVGYVSNIAIDAKDPTQVKILLNIEEGTPINTSTIATLMVQGLTGVAYISLTTKLANAPILVAINNQPYPIIKTAPSLLNRLDLVVSQLASNFSKTSAKLDIILSPQNMQAFSDTLKNLNTITTNIASNSDKINQVITSTNTLLANSAKASQQFSIILNNYNTVGTDVEKASQQLNTLIQNINTATLPALNDTVDNVQSLSQQLKQNPSVLIRGSAAPPPGPGE